MPDRGESQGDKWGAAAAAAAAAAGAAAGMTGPLGIVLGAGLAPGLATALRAVGGWYSERQTERVGRMIRTAAKIARLEPDLLVRRMEQTPERAELFVRTFRAAAEASAEVKLVALARSLATSAQGDSEQVQVETLFVHALSELEAVHLDVLERFGWSANALGLGDGKSADFDVHVAYLNSAQLEMTLPGLAPVIESVLAMLVQHGLLAYSTATPVTYGSGGAPVLQWALSRFGREALDRLEASRDLLASDV